VVDYAFQAIGAFWQAAGGARQGKIKGGLF